MRKIVLFEGKTTMGGMDVDLKIYRVEDNKKEFLYYEWDYNPYLVDENQADVHRGGINMADTLEDLLFRINMYKDEIRKIKKVVPNPNF